jgi:hypothetical protein
MTPTCDNCGSPLLDGVPVADFCGHCPPHRCDQCGGMDSMQTPCKCWVDVADIAFADLKGMFARDGLGLEGGTK